MPISVFIVIAGALAALPGSTAQAETISIDAGNNWFCSSDFQTQPCVTDITAGDSVVWTMVQGFHTVTECEAGHTNCGNGFDSGLLNQGETYSLTFSEPGTVSYYCAIHPDMTGVLNVQEPMPSPSPVPTTAPTDGGEAPAATATQSPAAVPQTGGQPSDGSGFAAALLLALAGGSLLVLSGGSALFAVRRR